VSGATNKNCLPSFFSKLNLKVFTKKINLNAHNIILHKEPQSVYLYGVSESQISTHDDKNKIIFSLFLSQCFSNDKGYRARESSQVFSPPVFPSIDERSKHFAFISSRFFLSITQAKEESAYRCLSEQH
jgi:hypothetical protein